MPPFVSLGDAKTKLSSPVGRAAAGEEIVIAKNGLRRARLVPMVSRRQHPIPANAMGIKYVATDFDASDPGMECLFIGDAELISSWIRMFCFGGTNEARR